MPSNRRRDLFEWLNPPKKTKEGYWVGEGIVARSGTMEYVELDADGKPVEFTEYVPEDTILRDLPNLEHKSIVIRHPEGEKDVGPSNYRYLNVGHVGRIRFMRDPQEPETLLAIAELHIMDQRGIQAVESGKFVELSPGYDADAPEQSGVSPQGIPYQTIQLSRDHNHLALVEDARGGDRMTLRRDSARPSTRRRDNANYPNQQQPTQHQGNGQFNQQPQRQDSGIDYDALAQALVKAMKAAGMGGGRQDQQPMQQQHQDMGPPRQDMAPPRQDSQLPRQDMEPPRQDSQDPNARRDSVEAQIVERMALLEEGKGLGVAIDKSMTPDQMRRLIVEHKRPHTRRDAASDEIRFLHSMLCEDANAQAPQNPTAPVAPTQHGGWGNQQAPRRDHQQLEQPTAPVPFVR